ncbi:MAG: FMN-binding protein [Treponema sp.]|jgi:uncharacterized protein with FMN-binding domain|nr:FMN-binding protein [Treponema sp.]
MKNSIFFIIVVVILAGCISMRNSKGINAADGVYESSGMGYKGPIYLRLRIENGSITEIDILESEEDPFVGGAAIEELIDLVLMYNSIDIDVISGATESSKGFLKALENVIMGL